ncbi:ATP-binding protein [Streptomyces sp. NPDC014894]|uniref:ATP-binding protein n=1 Tax=Streptomyces sp. NPDC014894 TaxID=3364931 RepID=UPI0036F85C0A
MPRDWAGESERDRSVQNYVESLLLPAEGSHSAAQRPMTLVLGPRGSGKTTLLRSLAEWAGSAPVVRLDIAEMARQEQRSVDVLKAVAFGLEPRKRHVPHISLPAFRLVCAALGADLDPGNRAAARRGLDQELAGPPSRWLTHVPEVAQVAASVVGLPAALTAALQLLPLGERRWQQGSTRWTLSRIRRATAVTSALDFLIELNLAYNSGADEDRSRTERVVCEVFLQEMRRAYARKDWAVRCLVLLDNVDNRLGGDLLRLLLQERRAENGPACGHDPLVVLAMAGSYPETLRDVEFGWQYAGDGHPGHWPPGTAFAPGPVTDGLRVGRLRDLTRNEVEQQTKEVLRSASAPAPRGGAGSRWLGWAVYELTRGQPEGTARVLAALHAFEPAVEWEERLCRVLLPATGLAPGLLERLLPIDLPRGLRQALVRASAAPALTQALVTRWMQDEATDHLRGEFHSFVRDRLRTLHIDTGDPCADGPPGTPHPLLRRLLLDSLDDPDLLHAGLRTEAEARGEPGLAAYHALATGDLPAAAAHLDAAFDRLEPEEWCAELCRLRRAPLPRSIGEAGDSPWSRYEHLVRHLADDAVGPRLRTVTRLLAASWLGPEPADVPATDHVGDPYREPLGDPCASLYAEINARFHTLATAHTQRVAWTAVLHDKAGQYDKEPWR